MNKPVHFIYQVRIPSSRGMNESQPLEFHLHKDERVVAQWRFRWSWGGVQTITWVGLTNQRVECLTKTTKCPKMYAVRLRLDQWQSTLDKPLEDMGTPTISSAPGGFYLMIGGQIVGSFDSSLQPIANAALSEIENQRRLRLESLRAKAPPTVRIQREVVTREIVKIPCKYCGTLNENTYQKCLGCHAPATR